jgi:hypothetical protein
MVPAYAIPLPKTRSWITQVLGVFFPWDESESLPMPQGKPNHLNANQSIESDSQPNVYSSLRARTLRYRSSFSWEPTDNMAPITYDVTAPPPCSEPLMITQNIQNFRGPTKTLLQGDWAERADSARVSSCPSSRPPASQQRPRYFLPFSGSYFSFQILHRVGQ